MISSITGAMMPMMLIGTLAPLVFVIGLVLVVLVYRYRRERQLHETITRLVEKGLPVPKELFPIRSAPKWRLFGALTLIGLGVGLIIYFCTQPQVHVGAQILDFNDWGIGAIPLAIGLAQLLAWKLEQPKSETSKSNSQE
jgi:NADH:ubiquinone oxidoreductase subunit K